MLHTFLLDAIQFLGRLETKTTEFNDHQEANIAFTHLCSITPPKHPDASLRTVP
jgi:hypothetical protein